MPGLLREGECLSCFVERWVLRERSIVGLEIQITRVFCESLKTDSQPTTQTYSRSRWRECYSESRARPLAHRCETAWSSNKTDYACLQILQRLLRVLAS